MDELEQSLLARWDRETLLVYADVLQTKGDPRGELITLDLEAAERAVTPELAQRRRKALFEWLGGSTIRGRPVHEASFRYGFATDFFATNDRSSTAADYLNALFKSPAGAYVRGVTIAVPGPRQLDDALEAIAGQPRPWLERLEIRVVRLDGSTVSERRVDTLIAATPRLHTLGVFGAQAIVAFPHAGVRHAITDPNRMPIVHTIPQLETLELLIDEGDLDGDDAGLVQVTASSIASIPGLRHLDLSRNEPTHAAAPARDDQPPPPIEIPTDVYSLAASLSVPRLRTLRMPSLQSRQHVAMLRMVLDRASSLEVTIARAYTCKQQLASFEHPRLRLPAPFPWPPESTLSPREALTITVPTEEYGDDVSLTNLIRLLEAQWDDLPPNARTAWLAFWDLLGDLPWEDADRHPVTKPFPALTLLTALEPLDDFILYSGTAGHWAQLAEKLRAADLPPDATVGVRRYWGW